MLKAASRRRSISIPSPKSHTQAETLPLGRTTRLLPELDGQLRPVVAVVDEVTDALRRDVLPVGLPERGEQDDAGLIEDLEPVTPPRTFPAESEWISRSRSMSAQLWSNALRACEATPEW